MVLVDTSVWIRFLAGREPFARQLDGLLKNDEVLAHDLVEGELLIGDRGGRNTLLRSYAKILRAPTLSHPELLSFVRARRLHGRGIGWIDAHLLASTLLASARLWTADSPLAEVAVELRIAHGVA